MPTRGAFQGAFFYEIIGAIYHLIFVVIDKMKEASLVHGLNLLEAIFSVLDTSDLPIVAYGTPSFIRSFISASIADKTIPNDRIGNIPIRYSARALSALPFSKSKL